MNVVYAIQSASVATEAGAQASIHRGQHWPADDPIVRAHPGLFSDDPRYGLTFSERPEGFDAAPVEQVTAGPGEKRGQVRRG